MADQKGAEYIPCPKCGGEKKMDCLVCHGLGTIPKQWEEFRERHGLGKLMWVKPPIQELEEIATKGEPPPLLHVPRESIVHELFAVGDRVRWKYPPQELRPEQEPFIQVLIKLEHEIRADYGKGPFEVVRIKSNPDRKAHFTDPDTHPQVLILKNEAGEFLPIRKRPRALSAEYFVKVGE